MSSQNRIIALIGAVKFVFILDFMMLMPLGPDVAGALSFSAERLGWLSASYTVASMLAGLLAVRWLDRFSRKPAFLLCFGALVLFTVLTPLVNSLSGLMTVRALTGLAGSPAVALGMAILIDAIPPQSRGRAIGRVMIAFSLAAIAGIPAALELSRWGGWTTPFLVVAALGALVWLAAWRWLPATSVPDAAADRVSPFSLLRQPAIAKACLIQAGSQFTAFLVVPHFSAFFLLNLGFPREYLGLLYLAGGISAMVLMQVLGHITDRAGPARSVLIASAGTGLGLTPFLGLEWGLLVVPFILFMAGNAGRNVSIAALTSQAPEPRERAGYLALEGIVQDLSVTLAAVCASVILMTGAAGELLNTHWLGALALLLLAATSLAVVRWQGEVARGH
ncbi:MFS transporter [Ketobacter sp.]|uniref:MFS transporter n=1 Tax=Ketobacter sp. TaxID=2083498 RepID=UPI000F279915|nr:MFS transporter [Ketobacter sp.]RLT96839.1 MAG: MFS transporter [Ketobacter sp.]